MRKELKVIIIIIFFGILLGISGNIIRRATFKGKVVSPFAKSFDLFSYFHKEERPKHIIYGYLPYWSLNASEHLQYDKLTDIAYFGLYLQEDGSFKKLIIDDQLEYEVEEPGYSAWHNNETLEKLIKKAKDRGVRVSLTIIAHDDESNDKFLECRDCWNTFLGNLISELKVHKISSVNLNFEYYEYSDGDKSDVFAEFTEFVNTNLDEVFEDSYVVVSAFADSIIKPRISSNVLELGKKADGIFIMGYDFRRAVSDTAGPTAPLKNKGKFYDYDLTTMLKDFLARVPPNKLILGVPYYGYNWVVESEEPYSKRLEGSDDTGFSESQTYSSIIETILEVDPLVYWDENAEVPFFSYISPETESLRMVYYDNAESLKLKYDLIKQNNLGGVGIWALGYDGGYTELWDLLYEEFVKE